MSEATANPAPTNAYDEVPYDSHPFVQTHPDRLATVATLFGLHPVPVEKCRVLEVGCASGGNIIPMAEALPESQFVGVELSRRQVEDGRQAIAALGLENLDLRQAHILEIDESFGKFDYIIAHGVFSWVRTEVQQKLFDICSQLLAPQGIAYVSYNTYPGWHMRRMIRDMMRYHAERFNSPKLRTRQARALLDFLAQSVKQPESAYTRLLQQELQTLRNQADYYLFHEHLEEVNDPIYFHEFMERATAKGLQYLGEARVGTMVLSNFGPDIEKTLRMLATDQIQVEQYMDFLRNRMFRETLLCSKRQAPNWSIQPETMRRFHVASPAFPVNADGTPRTEALDLNNATDNVSYRSPSGMSMATTQPLLKAAMAVLREAWPAALPFDELRAQARARLDGPEPSTQTVANDQQMLALGLLNCYMGSDLIELHVWSPKFTREVGERPVASPVARLQAPAVAMVTNRRHEVVRLNDLERQLLPLLDGNNDRAALVDRLQTVTLGGALTIQQEGQTLTEPDRVRAALESVLQPSLQRLANHALIVG